MKDHEQGLVKGAKLCFRYPYFYFQHGESTSTASQITSPASQKSKDLNKVPLLLQDLGKNIYRPCDIIVQFLWTHSQWSINKIFTLFLYVALNQCLKINKSQNELSHIFWYHLICCRSHNFAVSDNISQYCLFYNTNYLGQSPCRLVSVQIIHKYSVQLVAIYKNIWLVILIS